MNEPKFTKGPWKAHGTQDVDWVETEWKGHNGPANETRETTEYICKCGRPNGFNNSFLIAAAPEMYDLLQKIMLEAYVTLDESGEEIIAIPDGVISSINSILRKARGEQ